MTFEHLPPNLWLIVAVILVGAVKVRPRRRWRTQDPVRWFDYTQRITAMHRAGGQCEYFKWGRRCTNKAAETDHFYPHARGGATLQTNSVAACRAHNQAKGGRMPSILTRWRLWWSRRSYWPRGLRRLPGSWYRGSVISRMIGAQ